jgi:hypothetical protein
MSTEATEAAPVTRRELREVLEAMDKRCVEVASDEKRPPSERVPADMVRSAVCVALSRLASRAHTPAPESAGEMLQRLGMDGVKWAAEFHATACRLGYSDMEIGWLNGWFCNAVMAGYDHARWKYEKSAPPAPEAPAERVEEGVSCLCCGHIGERKCWHSEHADIYVCVRCWTLAQKGGDATSAEATNVSQPNRVEGAPAASVAGAAPARVERCQHTRRTKDRTGTVEECDDCLLLFHVTPAPSRVEDESNHDAASRCTQAIAAYLSSPLLSFERDFIEDTIRAALTPAPSRVEAADVPPITVVVCPDDKPLSPETAAALQQIGEAAFRRLDAINAPEGPYRVDCDHAGCDSCGGNKTWAVVHPDGTPEGILSGHSYGGDDAEDEAQEEADALNAAWVLGFKAAKEAAESALATARDNALAEAEAACADEKSRRRIYALRITPAPPLARSTTSPVEPATVKQEPVGEYYERLDEDNPEMIRLRKGHGLKDGDKVYASPVAESAVVATWRVELDDEGLPRFHDGEPFGAMHLAVHFEDGSNSAEFELRRVKP